MGLEETGGPAGETNDPAHELGIGRVLPAAKVEEAACDQADRINSPDCAREQLASFAQGSVTRAPKDNA